MKTFKEFCDSVQDEWNDFYIKHFPIGKLDYLLHKMLHQQEIVMSAIDNLNANVAALQTDVASLIAKVGSGGGVPEADVQAAADAVAAIDASVKTALGS